MTQRRTLVSTIVIALAGVAWPALSRARSQGGGTPRPTPAFPFGLVLGEATLDDAEAAWAAAGARLIGRSHAAIGAGSGIDGYSELGAERIVLIDVAEAPFEGTRRVRFAFFDGRLYAVQARLRPAEWDVRKSPPAMSMQEVLDLGQEIRARYGPPHQSLRDFAAEKGPNVFIWNFGRNTLTMTVAGMRGSLLIYNQPALAKKAEAYRVRQDRAIPPAKTK